VECIQSPSSFKPRRFISISFNLLKDAGDFFGQEAQIFQCAFYAFERGFQLLTHVHQSFRRIQGKFNDD
jgi:hypothetical protein